MVRLRWLPLVGAAIAAAAMGSTLSSGPADMLKELDTYRQSLISQAQEKSKNGGRDIDLTAIEGQVRAKAEEDVKGLDVAKVPPAEALDWAQICNLARHPRDAEKILLGYISSKPEPAKLFQAETMLLAASWVVRDDKTASAALHDMKPYDEASAISRASYVATYAPHLTNVMGDDEAVALIDKAIADVDTASLSDEAKINFSTVRYAGALGKIDIYSQAGQKDKALATIDEALKTATPSHRLHLQTTRNQLSLVGGPPPALKLDRGYGVFSGFAALKGKVVVLDFFAHWCEPCKLEFPEMKKMADDLKDKGLEVVGVTTYYEFYKDRSKRLTADEEFAKMADFIKEQNITWPVAFGGQENFSAYGATAIPFVVAVGRDGVVRQVDIGYSKDSFAKFRKEVEALLEAH
ncbi:MAG TPA: TlpA disulfide reductase family protein [Fimbriimonadaceae bacterium]|nr:TlpA disulfide reductase family protein [Fimbriimonadaceae bacterium]